MLAEALVLGLLIGLVLKGQLKNFEKLNFKLWYLAIFAAIIELSSNMIRLNEIQPYSVFVDDYVWYIKVVIYSLLTIVLIVNIRHMGIVLVFIGVVLNGIVILMNQGRMPVTIEGIETLVSGEYIEKLTSGSDLAHQLLTDQTMYPFLGDIIHIMPPYPFPKTISVGDIFMSIGIMVFIICVMKMRTCGNIGRERL